LDFTSYNFFVFTKSVPPYVHNDFKNIKLDGKKKRWPRCMAEVRKIDSQDGRGQKKRWPRWQRSEK
jgi:hypothetical protein